MILVGVGGGVPHYTDYKKHVRLGDVVISHAADGKRLLKISYEKSRLISTINLSKLDSLSRYVYTYCENAKHDPETGTYEFETKEYHPTNLILQEIATKLKTEVKLRKYFAQIIN